MIDPALREIAHPRALYERSPLPDSQNALSAWQAAGAAMVNAEELSNLASYGTECGCQEEGCATGAPPTPVEFVARAGELVSANREALTHVLRVLDIGRLQLTISRPSLEDGLPFDAVRNAARLLAVQGKRCELLGDWPSAVAANLQILKLGAMYGNCDGVMVNWLIALTIQGVAIQNLSKIVDHDLAPVEKREIVQTLPLILDRKSGARMLQSEFTNSALPMVQHIAGVGPHEVLGKVLHTFYSVGVGVDVDPTADLLWDSRDWAREMQSTIPMLLGDHPRLWDEKDTLRGISLDFAAAVADWLDDRGLGESIRTEHNAWQARRTVFSDSFPPQCVSEFLAVDLDAPGKFKPVTARQYAEARRSLRSIDNPLGLLVAAHLEPGIGPGILTANPDRVAREAHLRAAVANA